MSSSKGKDGGGDSNIQTFLRIKPSKNPSGYFSIDDLERDSLNFTLPENYRSDFINNSKTKYGFHFNGIIDANASQEQVFNTVGLAAVRNALEGFNSTIFAYGQTGSGKTFTLTGGPDKYSDRGLIPRTISMLFNEMRTQSDIQYKFYISYLELYNEQGYDLLDPSKDTKALEDLPKVTILEDEHGNYHLKNLSMHAADSEEDALNLLFLGDTNRAIAETPMNMASSRSHCIFSIALEARFAGSEKIRRSKLHLVDLAGSERVAKTNSSGSVLTEAKYINSSLFFLEMVIVALYEKATKGRTHIPYRNSMMTSVLRDSLGGNCKTIMVATINPEANHTEESLSTCRFAQRVSLIKNKASINEETDPTQLIKRLKNELLTLREEIVFLKGEAGEGPALSAGEVEELQAKCREYCFDPSPESVLHVGTLTLTKIKDVFAILKNLVLEQYNERRKTPDGNSTSDSTSGNTGNTSGTTSTSGGEEYVRQIKDLKSLLLQRDSEITILVNMVKRGKGLDDIEGVTGNGNEGTGNTTTTNTGNGTGKTGSCKGATTAPPRRERGGAPVVVQDDLQLQREKREKVIARFLFGIEPPNEWSVFNDAALSFEWFRERSPLNGSMNDNKDSLKERITEAKTLGERANQSRNTISYLKNSIEAIRRERALQRLNTATTATEESETTGGEEESPEETTYRRAIEQEKVVYKESFDRLKILKPEIEHIRKMLEKLRVQLQSQFDQWYDHLHHRPELLTPLPVSLPTPSTGNTSMSTGMGTGMEVSTPSSTTSSYSSASSCAMTTATATASYARTTSVVVAESKSLPPIYPNSSGGSSTSISGSEKSSSSAYTNNTANSSNNSSMTRTASNSNTSSNTTVPNRAEAKGNTGNTGSSSGSSRIGNTSGGAKKNDTEAEEGEEDDVNEDILAFYQAKEELLKRRQLHH